MPTIRNSDQIAGSATVCLAPDVKSNIKFLNSFGSPEILSITSEPLAHSIVRHRSSSRIGKGGALFVEKRAILYSLGRADERPWW
jgi:hypothetical protein